MTLPLAARWPAVAEVPPRQVDARTGSLIWARCVWGKLTISGLLEVMTCGPQPSDRTAFGAEVTNRAAANWSVRGVGGLVVLLNPNGYRPCGTLRHGVRFDQ